MNFNKKICTPKKKVFIYLKIIKREREREGDDGGPCPSQEREREKEMMEVLVHHMVIRIDPKQEVSKIKRSFSSQK